MKTNWKREAGIAICAALIFSGCGSTNGGIARKPVSEALRAKMGTVSVVYEGEPRVALDGMTKNKVEGAGKGALGGAGVGAMLALETGPLAPLFIPAFATVGAGAGAIAGSVIATDGQATRANIEIAEARMSEGSGRFSDSLQGELASLEGWDWAFLEGPESLARQRGIQEDSRLYVRLDLIRGGGEGNLSPSSKISFNLEGVAALYLGDLEVAVEERRYSYTSRTMPLKRWTKDDGIELEREIVRMARESSISIVDDFFREGSVEIQALLPKSSGVFGARTLKSNTVDFRWIAIDGQEAIDESFQNRLRYRLRVIDDLGNAIIHDDLRESELQVKLEANRRYRWSVRAEYKVRGATRASPWTKAIEFRTPKESWFAFCSCGEVDADFPIPD